MKTKMVKKIWKWKWKWFEHLPTVFEKYRIFVIFYRILLIEISYSRTMPAHSAIYNFRMSYLYIFRESWLIYPNPKSQSSDVKSWDCIVSWMAGLMSKILVLWNEIHVMDGVTPCPDTPALGPDTPDIEFLIHIIFVIWAPQSFK